MFGAGSENRTRVFCLEGSGSATELFPLGGLPKKTDVRKVVHYAAVPYREIGAFVAELRKQTSISARALEFLILTATRTGETLGAAWDEMDLDGRMWTIPPDRMKAGVEHRVPLSARAIAIVQEMDE